MTPQVMSIWAFYPPILSQIFYCKSFLVWWSCLFSYLTATHGEEVFGELECLCKPLMCKLSITSRLKIQKITFLLSFEGLSLSSHLTRIVGVAPPLRGGATVPSALRAELCKYAPFPFLLPSAGLNANSKYLRRAALRDGK